MELKKLNLILSILCIFLLLNIFFDFSDLSGSVVKENLGCEINGNLISDVNICCHEMQRFLSCENGKCVNKHYEILADKEMLKYCKKSGYDVKF